MSESKPTTATLNAPEPRAKPEPFDLESISFRREVRLAVVLYGGTSLAIYINGVAQELLHLVRATAPRQPGVPGSPRMFDELTPVERVYREVSCRLGTRQELGPNPGSVIQTRIVVDVISGTSAGGLNGMFLAKTLANGGDMESLRRLWIEEGDLGLLLNDERSLRDTPYSARDLHAPESVLNSSRMYLKLLEALKEMKPSTSGPREEPLLADELDLFMTATDLTGLPLPIRISNGIVHEMRHKNVFHFIGATKRATGGGRNDFGPANDPFFSFAGRCTSSFPMAFEPMQLADIERLRDKRPDLLGSRNQAKAWQSFYADYLREPEAGKYGREDFEYDFWGRSFADGGYLDNKPFSHAISALRWRRAGPEVDRKLIYVEPSPGRPEFQRMTKKRPNAFQNIRAAAELPRYETIREDLERVLERNRKIEHVRRSVRFVPGDVRAMYRLETPAPAVSGTEYARLWLRDMVRGSEPRAEKKWPGYGIAYGSYHRLKVAELTTELAEVVTRVAGLDDESDDLIAVRVLMSAWRQELFNSEEPAPAEREERKLRKLPRSEWSENRFLLIYDLSYRLRRMAFLRDIAQRLGGLRPATTDAGDAVELGTPDDAAEVLRAAGMVAEIEECQEHREHFHDAVTKCASVFSEIFVDLRRTGRQLRSRGDESPLAPLLAELNLSRTERRSVLTPERSRDRVRVARHILGLDLPRDGNAGAEDELRHRRRSLVWRAAWRARFELSRTFRRSARAFANVVPGADELESQVPAAGAERTRWIVQRCLRFYYDRYEHYDVSLFPMTYGADVGELAEVDVVRISPSDAKGLLNEWDEQAGTRRECKLAGTRLGNFGAFLDATWRQSDMLWGRLDAAEILIKQLMKDPVGDEETAELERIVRRAQVAILSEELGPLDECLGRTILVEAFLHSHRDHPDSTCLTEMLDRLEPHHRGDPVLARILNRRAVTDAYAHAFKRHRRLEARKTYDYTSRAAAIFGNLLEGLSGPGSRVSGTLGRYLAFAGRSIWNLVELAVPESIGMLLFRKMVAVLILLELMLWLGGALLGSEPAEGLGARLLGITGGIYLVWMVLHVQLAGKRPILRPLLIGLASLVLLLAAIGTFMFPDFLEELAKVLAPVLFSFGFIQDPSR